MTTVQHDPYDPAHPRDITGDAQALRVVNSLQAAQTRLGVELPASLRQMYTLIGKRPDLTRAQDMLLTPEELAVDDSGAVLVFRVENQGVAQWGIPVAVVCRPDPPVVFRLPWDEPAGREWRPFLDRLSLACMEMVLSEWILSGAAFADNRELDEEAETALGQHFRRLPMPDYPMWAMPSGPPTRWFAGHGTILRADAGTWLWAGAATSAAIAELRRTLPGAWLIFDR